MNRAFVDLRLDGAGLISDDTVFGQLLNLVEHRLDSMEGRTGGLTTAGTVFGELLN